MPEGVHRRGIPTLIALVTLVATIAMYVPTANSAGATSAAPGAPCGTTADARTVERRLRHQGVDRRYLVWRPAGTMRAPVLLLFHGWSTSPEAIAATSGLPAAAAANGWLVVAPQGSGKPSRWALPGRLAGPNDVRFVGAVVRDVGARECADLDRVSAAGFSNGAAFTALLACRVPLDAVALVGGAGLGRPCKVRTGLPVLMVHGEADHVVRIEGGPVLGGRLHAVPLSTASQQWTASGASVRTIVVPGWGHTWPQAATGAVLATFQS